MLNRNNYFLVNNVGLSVSQPDFFHELLPEVSAGLEKIGVGQLPEN